MPVSQGWLRCDDPAADCNCPVGWDDPGCESTGGYGNGMTCRRMCYDRHRECNEAQDASIINCLDIFCTGTDTCMIMVCPASPKPEGIFCNGMECDDSWDRDTCCGQRAECCDMVCPDGYVNSEWAVRTEITCKGIECTVEADLDRCCFPVVYCDKMISTGEGAVCPEGYTL